MADDQELKQLHGDAAAALLRAVTKSAESSNPSDPGEHTRCLAEAYERVASNRPPQQATPSGRASFT